MLDLEIEEGNHISRKIGSFEAGKGKEANYPQNIQIIMQPLETLILVH